MPAASDQPPAAADDRPVPERLVDAAVTLLAEEGPAAIKARAVAARAGMSSMVVYSHFGGVPELLAAVVDHGFGQLESAFVGLGTSDDPVADLFSMALRTLRYARANPHLYDAMFGLSNRATYRPAASRAEHRSGHSAAFHAAYAHVIAAAGRLAGGDLAVQDAEPVAGALWSFVHGYVSLDLAGHFSDVDDPVRRVLMPMGVTFCVGLGVDRSAAQASHERAFARDWPGH